MRTWMLRAGRKKRRLSWIIRKHDCLVGIADPLVRRYICTWMSGATRKIERKRKMEEFRLPAHGEAELFVRVSPLVLAAARHKRKKYEIAGSNRQGSLDCITLGYHMYGNWFSLDNYNEIESYTPPISLDLRCYTPVERGRSW